MSILIVLFRVCLSLLFSRTYHQLFFYFFFFNDTATTEIYTLSLHDALPISVRGGLPDHGADLRRAHVQPGDQVRDLRAPHHERRRCRMIWSRNLRSTARTSWSAT